MAARIGVGHYGLLLSDLLMSSLRLSYSVCATCVWQLMDVCQLQPAIQIKYGSVWWTCKH